MFRIIAIAAAALIGVAALYVLVQWLGVAVTAAGVVATTAGTFALVALQTAADFLEDERQRRNVRDARTTKR